VTQDVNGKVAVVSGAASGIGEAVARALSAAGAEVAAVDCDEDALHTAVSKLRADGLKATAFPADVTNERDVNRTVSRIMHESRGIDLLVNSAGILRPAPVWRTSPQDWSATLAVNTTGVFLLSQAVVGPMAARGGGAIVTVASNAAHVPRTGMAAYAASKAAAVMFTKCLGLEVAHLGIRCNIVSPGSTDTPMLRTLFGDGSGPQLTIAGDPQQYRVGIPLGRLASPVDIAAAVLFLLSDTARHITMQEVTVDGGAGLGA
jgi:2,3-dihydro-2,3-dihydroxybenzoate dehydrogenase